MNRQEIIKLLNDEISFNEKEAIKYLGDKKYGNASNCIYANERLIKLGNNLNGLQWNS